MDSIGAKIKNLRKRAGMTQSQLAEIMGVNTDAVSKWETGRVVNIPAKKIRKIATQFGVPLDYLMPEAYDDDDDDVPTGDRLYALRLQSDLTRGELANRAGIRESRYGDIEDGSAIPTINELTNLCQCLGVDDLSQLLPRPDSEYYVAGVEYGRTHPQEMATGSDSGRTPDEDTGQDTCSEDERKLLEAFSRLNSDGKTIAIERVEELSEISRFRAQ